MLYCGMQEVDLKRMVFARDEMQVKGSVEDTNERVEKMRVV